MISPGRAFSLNVTSLRQIGHSTTIGFLQMETAVALSQALADRVDLFDVEDQIVLLKEPGH